MLHTTCARFAAHQLETFKSSFFYDVGASQYLKGTGAYAGVKGSDTFEFFSFGTDECPGDLCGYQGILVARAQFVPQPQVWMVMIAGLALLGGALRRRS